MFAFCIYFTIVLPILWSSGSWMTYVHSRVDMSTLSIYDPTFHFLHYVVFCFYFIITSGHHFQHRTSIVNALILKAVYSDCSNARLLSQILHAFTTVKFFSMVLINKHFLFFSSLLPINISKDLSDILGTNSGPEYIIRDSQMKVLKW